MEPELAKILDNCIEKINDASSIEVCLAYHPEMRKELEPLLYTTRAISKVEKVKPSEEFRKTAKGRLMARISEEGISIHEQDTGWQSRLAPYLNILSVIGDGFCRTLDNVKRGAIPVALCLVTILISVLSVANAVPGTASMNAGCTLTVLNGVVEILGPESTIVHRGIDGTTLDAGTRVITSENSRALLTFFDGSTLFVEPGTDIEIEELAVSTEQSISVVLKQWMGKTWSRVVKMTDSDSHYEIQTPSAVAVVRGTFFSTEVDDVGETQVHTREGLVSVFALGDEVLVSPGRQTTVLLGAPPCRPVFVAPGEDDSQDGADFLVMNNNGNANGPSEDNNGNAYGLNKDNDNIADTYTWGYGYNGNAYGLNKDDSGNASGLDKDNNGNAYGLNDDGNGNASGLDKDNNGNAYGLNDDGNGNAGGQNNNNNGNAGGQNNNNNGNDKDNNGKAKGKDKDSGDTGTPPGDTDLDEVNNQDADVDESVDEELDEDNDQDEDDDGSNEDEDEDDDEDDETDDEKDKDKEDKDKDK